MGRVGLDIFLLLCACLWHGSAAVLKWTLSICRGKSRQMPAPQFSQSQIKSSPVGTWSRGRKLTCNPLNRRILVWVGVFSALQALVVGSLVLWWVSSSGSMPDLVSVATAQSP
jgi:hypothetical protein